MPAIFFLSLPQAGASGAVAESRSQAERHDFGYSGQLSFDGGFDQYGFVPQRAYGFTAETPVCSPAE